ncbi:MAG: S8 family serine peptidase [Pseudomonadota bacterium]
MIGNASKNIRNFNVNVGAGLKPALFVFKASPLRGGGKVWGGFARHMLHATCYILLLLLTACGSNRNNAIQEDVATPITKEITPEDMIMSDRYLGELVVHFRDDLVVRLKELPPPSLPRIKGGGVSTTKQQPRFEVRNFYYQSLSDDLNRILEEHPSVDVRRYLTMEQEEYDTFKRDLEDLNSEELPDLNSIYYFKAEPKEALILYNKLKNLYGVEYIYPHLQKVLTATTTPDLSSQQGYLTSNGGIDAQYAWNLGVMGKGVHIYEEDSAFNFDHEDLQLDYTVYNEKTNPKGSLVNSVSSLGAHLPPEKQPFIMVGVPLDAAFAHGTAVAGVLNASHNNGTGNFGVKGIAPDAKLLAGLTDERNLYYGAVVVIESAVTGKDGCEKTTGGLDDPCFGKGQLPCEVVPDEMKYYQTLAAIGITVVEGAGNSSLDIGDPSQYTGKWSIWVNPTTQDSGAIMVGASDGANMQKAAFSNYSPRVDAYSWGKGIVTTSYPYGDAATSPFYWSGPNGPTSQDPTNDKNRFYTNRFNGTSGATAIVGGAVTLAQSRFMQLAGNGRMRYIMPKKMRELVRTSGDSQKDTTNQNIGVQPRMDKLLKVVDNYWQTISAKYPALKQQLGSTNRMTKQEIIAMRSDGVGIVCIKYDPDGSSSDPLCSDGLLWPRADQMSVDMDIEGDGLMDLVSWKRGEFKIDLSSQGAASAWCSDLKGVRETDGYCDKFPEKYGSWDIVIKYTDINSKWLLPYVKDMDADHRSDLMLYDKEHGRWYIEYMNVDYISKKENRIASWDKTLQYDWKDELNIDPWKSKYSRPAVSDLAAANKKDYSYADGWTDISILCSDGYWRVDFGGLNGPDGKWDIKTKYLTDEQLKVAPGWAYQPYVSSSRNYESIEKLMVDNLPYYVEALYVKNPDTILNGGKFSGIWDAGAGDIAEGNSDHFEYCRITKECSTESPVIGGNESILIPYSGWSYTRTDYPNLGVFIPGESFDLLIRGEASRRPENFQPVKVDLSCKPLTMDDRYIFQCKDEWIIVADSYRCANWGKNSVGKDICTDETWGIKHIPLSYDPGDFTLPGQPYIGGISYLDTQKIIQNSLLENPNTPPPIIVDMPMIK